MCLMKLYIGTKYKVCRFNRTWNMDNCLQKFKLRHNDVITLSNSNTDLARAYLIDILNFILIGYNRAEIQSRKLIENYEGKMDIMSLWPWPLTKFTNFNWVRATAVSNYLAKTASKSLWRFDRHFVLKRTVRQTHTETNWSKI